MHSPPRSFRCAPACAAARRRERHTPGRCRRSDPSTRPRGSGAVAAPPQAVGSSSLTVGNPRHAFRTRTLVHRMTAVTVSPFTGADSEWDDFVRGLAGWTPFHLIGWRAVIGRVFGHECVYLVARDVTSERIAAVLPLVRVRSLLFGHYLVSMPFLNYGGPLGGEAGIRALAMAAVDLAARTGVKLLE